MSEWIKVIGDWALAVGLIIFVMSSCAPVQDAAQRAVRAVGAADDPSSLEITATGLLFDPGGVPAHQVVVYIGGQRLQTDEEECAPLQNGIACALGDVTTPAALAVLGSERSASVSFYRGEDSLPVYYYVRE